MALQPDAFAAGLGIVGLDQSDQGLPWHHRIHLSQELLSLGALFGGGLLENAKSRLLPTYHPSCFWREIKGLSSLGLTCFAKVPLTNLIHRLRKATERYEALQLI